MTNQRHTRQWQNRRAQFQTLINQRATTPNPIRCWRHGHPIPPNQPKAWDLGHTTDQALGGTIANTWPECATGNRAEGGRLRHALALAPLPSRAL